MPGCPKAFSLFLSALLSLSALFISGPTQAAWQYETFKSGSIQHQVAVSAPQKNNRELEVFCSSRNRNLSLALYLPDQRFRRRDQIEIHVQVDKKATRKLIATRHAMAITSPNISRDLITELSSGNRVRVTFPISTKSKQTEVFPLRQSARALSSVLSQCG